jgi:hypothetical protein
VADRLAGTHRRIDRGKPGDPPSRRAAPARSPHTTGDWLDDADAGFAALTGKPGAAATVTRTIRRHVTACAATASLTGALLVVGALELGEHWPATQWPVFLTLTIIYAAGLFAFCLISNAILQRQRIILRCPLDTALHLSGDEIEREPSKKRPTRQTLQPRLDIRFGQLSSLHGTRRDTPQSSI